LVINAQGTANNPVYIRGASYEDRPVFSCAGGWRIENSSYLIIENITFENQSLSIAENSHHIAVRHSEAYGYLGRATVMNTHGDDVVFYHNHSHDHDYDPNGVEIDTNIFGVGTFSERTYIVDNLGYHTQGDGIAIQGGTSSEDVAHNIYIGRNLICETHEDFLDAKESRDLIITQNRVWGFQTHTGNGISIHDQDINNLRSWVLYNEVYGATAGIIIKAQEAYIIGNLVVNTYGDESTGSDGADSTAISLNGSGTVLNNTVHEAII